MNDKNGGSDKTKRRKDLFTDAVLRANCQSFTHPFHFDKVHVQLGALRAPHLLGDILQRNRVSFRVGLGSTSIVRPEVATRMWAEDNVTSSFVLNSPTNIDPIPTLPHFISFSPLHVLT